MSVTHVRSLVLILVLSYPRYGRTSTNTSTSYHPCIRPCTKNNFMTCHYNFIIEQYVTIGKACKYCYPNGTHAQQLMQYPDCQCVLADGFERGILAINRMLPGPSIQVCKGDTIVVDTFNNLDGKTTAIHWHGIHQNGSPYYDGVPYITQCPIASGTRFRYIFKAEPSGTHFYHSHSSAQMIDGLYGSLVVRDSPEDNEHRTLYDEDLPEHVIVFSDFMHIRADERIPGYSTLGNGQFPETFLINGLGRYLDLKTRKETNNPYHVFTVQRGKRYRFRLINSIGTSCEARLRIEGHPLTIIASDGNDIEPFTVDAIVFYSGERFDVIVNANQVPGAYWIQIISPKGCLPKSVHQLAILRYEGHPSVPYTQKPTYKRNLPVKKAYVDVCSRQSQRICIKDLRPKKRESFDVAKAAIDRSVFLPYQVISYDDEKLFKPGTYMHFLMAPGKNPITSVIDGISFQFPAFPILSQAEDISRVNLCNFDNSTKTVCLPETCTCPHIIKFGLHDFVEIMLADVTENVLSKLPHPFHLHGYSFYVMELGYIDVREGFIEENARLIWKRHQDNLKNLNSTNKISAVKRDTILIPHNGYAIIRIKLDNPGFWFFHCHFIYHLTIGMSLILQVGDYEDLPAVPKNFPKCGNYM